jgi:hypothetical protein
MVRRSKVKEGRPEREQGSPDLGRNRRFIVVLRREIKAAWRQLGRGKERGRAEEGQGFIGRGLKRGVALQEGAGGAAASPAVTAALMAEGGR